MGEAIRAAEARLHARMADIEARYAVRWRLRSYGLPVGLVAGALLISLDFERQPGGALVMTPLIAAAIWSRAWGGITAARVSVALVAPIVLWVGYVTQGIYGVMWAPFLVLALIGLCIERASSVRYEPEPPRRSVPDPVHRPQAYRMLIR